MGEGFYYVFILLDNNRKNIYHIICTYKLNRTVLQYNERNMIIYMTMNAKNIETKRAVYSRKSREDSEDTLEKHRLRLEEFIKKNGFTNVDWYEEVVSGSSIESRHKFVELLEKVQNREYEAVIVIDFDRLSRGDTYDRGRIERAFKDSQTLIMTVKGEVLDYTNKNEALTANVKGLLANYELEQIITRLNDGKKSAVKKGRPHSGIVPYGYVWDRNLRQAVVDEHEKKVYRLMIKWYVEDGLSLNAIAKKLNDFGYKTSRGGTWYPERVSVTLLNEFHLGYVMHGYYKSIPTGRFNAKGEVIYKIFKNPNPDEIIKERGNHEPMKTEEEHAKIFQKSIENRRYGTASPTKSVHSFKLKSLIRCPHCGLVLAVVMNGNKKTPHIRKCLRNSKNRKPECNSTQGVNESILFEILLKDLRNYRDELFKEVESDKNDNSLNVIEMELSLLQESLEKSKKKISKAKEMFEADVIDINELKFRVSSEESQCRKLEGEISIIQKSVELTKKEKKDTRRLVWSSEDVVKLLENNHNFSDEEINKILKLIILYISYEIDDDNCVILTVEYR